MELNMAAVYVTDKGSYSQYVKNSYKSISESRTYQEKQTIHQKKN